MQVAITHKQTKIVEFLLTNGYGDINAIDFKDCSALYYAIILNQKEVCDMLLKRGATVISGSNERLANLLCSFGAKGELDKIKLMHKCKVDLAVSNLD